MVLWCYGVMVKIDSKLETPNFKLETPPRTSQTNKPKKQPETSLILQSFNPSILQSFKKANTFLRLRFGLS
jgi:hypothetical protein